MKQLIVPGQPGIWNNTIVNQDLIRIPFVFRRDTCMWVRTSSKREITSPMHDVVNKAACACMLVMSVDVDIVANGRYFPPVLCCIQTDS